MANEAYLSILDQKREKLFGLSDAIWEAAELAFSERKSAELLTEALAEEGFEVTSPAYGVETAFTAKFGSGRPFIGILGEFDALAGLSQEAGVVEKRAKEGMKSGHGCGHNMLGVGALAGAIAVKEYLQQTGASGTVVYYGCPGEEGGSGKAFMAREGAFKDLDCALTWHPGEVNAVYTDASLANIQVLYRFRGISSHAAGAPEMGRSALDALELMNIGTNFLREHMIQEARVHYAITDTGGVSPNVVQNYAEAIYLIRAPKVGQTQELFARVNKIAEGAAMMTETSTEREFIKSCSNFVSNRVLEKEIYRAMQGLPLPAYEKAEYAYAESYTKTVAAEPGKTLDKIKETFIESENAAFLEERKKSAIYDFVVPYEERHPVKAGGGSTDVGDVSWQCPTAQFWAACWAPNTPGHSWQIVSQGTGPIAHEGLLYAGKLLGATAVSLIEQPETLAAARTEFEAKFAGQTYAPIPSGVKPRPMGDFAK